jgi:hypothetical protein
MLKVSCIEVQEMGLRLQHFILVVMVKQIQLQSLKIILIMFLVVIFQLLGIVLIHIQVIQMLIYSV